MAFMTHNCEVWTRILCEVWTRIGVDEQFSSSSTSIIFFLHPSDIANALGVLGFEALALVFGFVFCFWWFWVCCSFSRSGSEH